MRLVQWFWRAPRSIGVLILACACVTSSADVVEHPTDDTATVTALDGRLAPDGSIGVIVTGLHAWSETPGHSPWRLVPYIQGKPLNGLYPTSVNLRLDRIQYDLSITPANERVWIHALSPPMVWRNVRFSVGLENEDPLKTRFTEQYPVRLAILNPYLAVTAVLVMMLCTGVFVRLALTTSLLTETWVQQGRNIRVRYSLAKVQLAVWFFVVFTSFIVIWLATGSYGTINVSVISLLGISSGTALGDAYIHSHEAGKGVAEENASGHPPARLPTGRRSVRHLFRDVLTDGDGYSIYRFQMLAWTSALLLVFLASTWYTLKMPTFNVELLYLLGLSSGTFVANRIPESWKPPMGTSAAASATANTIGGGPVTSAHQTEATNRP